MRKAPLLKAELRKLAMSKLFIKQPEMVVATFLSFPDTEISFQNTLESVVH